MLRVLNSNTRSISSIECVMVLARRLGLVDRVWHAARDLGTSTRLVQANDVRNIRLKLQIVSTHIQSIHISLENYRFVRVRTGSNGFSKLLAPPNL